MEARQNCIGSGNSGGIGLRMVVVIERKIFWLTFIVLGLAADIFLPLWWGIAATIPALFLSWWVAYRSHWF